MRDRLLAGLLLGVLAIAAVILWNRDRMQPVSTPEEAVTAMFDSAAKGDDGSYLAFFSGEYRRSLESNRSQVGQAAFRQSLARTAAGMKGIAITQSALQPAEGVALDVDLVYADRNEKQRMLLVQEGGRWSITAIETSQMEKPPVAYGTPVFDDSVPPPASAAAESEAEYSDSEYSEAEYNEAGKSEAQEPPPTRQDR